MPVGATLCLFGNFDKKTSCHGLCEGGEIAMISWRFCEVFSATIKADKERHEKRRERCIKNITLIRIRNW